MIDADDMLKQVEQARRDRDEVITEVRQWKQWAHEATESLQTWKAENESLRAQLATARTEALESLRFPCTKGDPQTDSACHCCQRRFHHIEKALATAPAAKPRRCPTCDSHNPALHPAVQLEGEVQYCSDPWHGKCGTCGGFGGVHAMVAIDLPREWEPCTGCGGTGVRR